MPKDKKAPAGGLTCRAAAFDKPESVNEDQRTVDFIAATEAVVKVIDWERWEVVDEVLLMSGCHFPQKVPLLDTHSRESVSNVIGSFRSMRVEGDKLVGTAHFASDQTSVDSFGKVRDGHITDVSVGYRVNAHVWVEKGQTTNIEGRSFTGPLRVATDWTVREVSLAPIGADENAKVRSLESVNTSVEENTMDEKLRALLVKDGMRADASPEEAEKYYQGYMARTATAAPEPVPAEPVKPDDSARALEAERTRTAEIAADCFRFDVPADKTAEYIKSGTSADAVRKAILGSLAEDNQPLNLGGSGFERGRDDADKKRSAVRDALLLRSGVKVEKPADGAMDMRGYSVADMCRTLTGSRAQNPHDIIERAMSSSDLPVLLGDVANIFILETLEKADTTFRLWVGDAPSLRDLKAKKIARGIIGGSADIMPEGMEYKIAQFYEKAETLTPVKFGKGFAVTLEALINDDLSVFTEVPAGLALIADRALNKACYDALLSGKMQDGKSVFDATHNNIGTASAPTIAAIGAMKKLMMKQTDMDGTSLNIQPKFILSPIELFDVFDSIRNTLTYKDADGAEIKNTSMSGIELITDGYLDTDSLKAWYLAGAKGSSVKVAYLQGFETPQVKMEEVFRNDTLTFKVKQYAGAKASEFRTVAKNAGV